MITEVSEFLQRVSPSKAQVDESIELFDQTIVKELQQRSEANENRMNIISKAVEPFQQMTGQQPSIPVSSVNSLKELAVKEHEQHRQKIQKTPQGLEERKQSLIQVNDATRIMGSPYDTVWTNGAAGYAHKNSGEFGFSPITTGQAAAAVGVYVSPAQDAIGRFTAYVPVTYSWTDWVTTFGQASTNGGIGVIIYDANTQEIMADNRSELWKNTQIGTGFSNESDMSTYLSNTSSAETYFLLRAGGLYLIWVWCWGQSGFSGAALSIASMAAKMPFVVVKPYLSI